CNNLTSISASNSFYSSYDGCLYNSSGSRLILVPPGKSSISFSGNLRTIGAKSFSYNRNIRTVTLPNSADSIEAGAFANSAVNSITIPKSVVSIGSQGSWKPGELYGYQKSAASKFASANGITFIALDPGSGSTSSSDTGSSTTSGITNNDDPDSPDDDDDNSNNDDPDEPDNNNSNSNSSKNNNSSSKNGGNSSNSSKNGGSSASGGASRGSNGSGGSSTAGGAGRSYNGKDATPKTADTNIDPRYAMCGVLLLLGIFIMVSGNKRKLTIVNKKSKE
ncbi:MAG: leucine-rich repeat domain-containing protein, partial [Lachnospiraceae bacterium]|nr:leucine-rich repeat domain-containing protein [Lachnospiraceae bacterium]